MSVMARSRALISYTLLLGCIPSAFAQTGYTYTLDSEYSGANFFQDWNFYTGGDPTGGYVTFYGQQAALQSGLINSSANAPTYIGVDYQTVTNVNGAGRPSVRISTQKAWTHGLFIGDFNHAPGGICGTWPAFWTLGPNWPYNGEIDILEGVNQLTQNGMSLHSNVNCSIAGDPSTETGAVQGQDCAYYVQYGSNAVGCGVLDSRPTSYGTGFNAGGGGVYAMQWTSDYIRVWFFPRNQIPQDITSLTPNPSVWGLPAANLQGSCNIDQRFQSHNIIFDNTFCGSYAGVPSVWNSSTNSCLLQTGYPTCNAFVAAQPAAFQNSYWSINSVRVYQLQAAGASASTSSSAYIASLQPTASLASSASSMAVPVPTASLCPTYNFTVVQSGNFQYEIECGYNPPGADLGRPYPNYPVNSFEDCVGGCNYWNTNNGSYVCGGVAYNFVGKACYWKESITSAPAAPNFYGARLIYYGYPQATDNPNVATSTTSTSAFVSSSVAPQFYSNPTVTQSSRALSTASASLSGGGVGAGFSVSASSVSSDLATSSATTSSAGTSTTASSTSTSTTGTISNSKVSTSTSTSNLRTTSSAIYSSSTTSSQLSSSTTTRSTTSSTTMVVMSSSTTISSVSTTPTTSTTTTSVPTSSPRPASSSPSMTSSSTTSSLLLTSSSPPISSSSRMPSSSSSSSSSHTLSSSFQASSIPLSSTMAQPTPSTSSSRYSPAPTPLVATSVSSLFASSASSVSSSAIVLASNNPQTIAQFAYGGCQGSSNNFAGFRQVESEPTLTIDQCVSDCYKSAFAGIFGSTCYCADDPSVANYFVTYPGSECSTPCPGNPSDSCGGVIATSQQQKRQAAVAYTIYNNTNIVPGPGGVSSSSSSFSPSSTIAAGSVLVGPIGTSSNNPHAPTLSYPTSAAVMVPSSISSVSPTTMAPSTSAHLALSSGTIILAPGAGSLSSGGAPAVTLPPTATTSMILRPTAITTIFVDVCDVCEHGMTTATTIVTMMHCGCTESVDQMGSTTPIAPPSIPMTTTIKTCNCGKENAPSTTEVTVPCTSQIEEMSSSMASMLASAAPGGVAPAAAPASSATSEAGSEAPGASNGASEAGGPGAASNRQIEAGSASTPAEPNDNAAATASEATSADVPEMTNTLAPEGSIPAGNNNTVEYATTQTIHLQSTESSNATAPNNGSMSVSAPRLASPSATKKSEGSETVERAVGFMAAALFCAVLVMSLL